LNSRKIFQRTPSTRSVGAAFNTSRIVGVRYRCAARQDLHRWLEHPRIDENSQPHGSTPARSLPHPGQTLVESVAMFSPSGAIAQKPRKFRTCKPLKTRTHHYAESVAQNEMILVLSARMLTKGETSDASAEPVRY
jgi:hypothetical protein